jgi:hypothetical protein
MQFPENTPSSAPKACLPRSITCADPLPTSFAIKKSKQQVKHCRTSQYLGQQIIRLFST